MVPWLLVSPDHQLSNHPNNKDPRIDVLYISIRFRVGSIANRHQSEGVCYLGMVLIKQCKQVLVFHGEGFQQPVPSKGWAMIKMLINFNVYLNKFSMIRVDNNNFISVGPYNAYVHCHLGGLDVSKRGPVSKQAAHAAHQLIIVEQVFRRTAYRPIRTDPLSDSFIWFWTKIDLQNHTWFQYENCYCYRLNA